MDLMNNGALTANASRALERYREMERLLEAEVAERLAKLEMVRDFVAALTDKPRQPRKPRMGNAEAALQSGSQSGSLSGLQSAANPTEDAAEEAA
jgi:hypothetical protein